jgi:EmrB/QacA subfamily drug resistance transporter
VTARSPGAKPGLVIAAAIFAGVLAPLNSTMIVVALPEMLADLGASLTWGTWVVVSYLVAMAAVQPLGGALGDRFGRRRLLLLGLGGFGLASLAAALAPSVEVLIAARTAQAVTGASAIPNATALVRTLVPTAARGRAFGLIGAGIGVAAALGPPLGGLVTGTFGWRWIFALNLLVLVPALALAARVDDRTYAARVGRFDLLGSALMLTTLVGFALAATLWRVPGVPWSAVVALALVAAVAGWSLRRHVARVAAPVVDLRLLGRPGFLAAGGSILCSNLTMYTILLALPVFLAQLVGWGAREIGLLLAGMSLLMLVFGPVGGGLADRFGRRAPALAGTLVATLGAVPLVFVSTDWSWPAYLVPLMVVGTGIGLAGAPVQAAAMEAAAADEAGQAAGMFSTMRYMGSITGAAGMAAILGGAADETAFRALFGLLVLAAAAAAVASSRLPAARAPTA